MSPIIQFSFICVSAGFGVTLLNNVNSSVKPHSWIPVNSQERLYYLGRASFCVAAIACLYFGKLIERNNIFCSNFGFGYPIPICEGIKFQINGNFFFSVYDKLLGR